MFYTTLYCLVALCLSNSKYVDDYNLFINGDQPGFDQEFEVLEFAERAFKFVDPGRTLSTDSYMLYSVKEKLINRKSEVLDLLQLYRDIRGLKSSNAPKTEYNRIQARLKKSAAEKALYYKDEMKDAKNEDPEDYLEAKMKYQFWNNSFQFRKTKLKQWAMNELSEKKEESPSTATKRPTRKAAAKKSPAKKTSSAKKSIKKSSAKKASASKKKSTPKKTVSKKKPAAKKTTPKKKAAPKKKTSSTKKKSKK